MDMNLRDIRAFIAVVETGSFTRAAARLHLSQPALTVQVRRLENAIGTRLFDRNSRKVSMTPAGRELLPALQKSLRDIEQLVTNAHALGDRSRGVIRLACLPTFAASLLPGLILEMKKTTPRASFYVRDVVASTVNALVRSEEVDIGLTGGNVSDAALEILYSGSDHLVAVFPENHPHSLRRYVELEHLLSEPLVLTAKGTSVRECVDAALAKAGLAAHISCEPTYMTTAVAMVRSGLGVTIVPRAAREVLAEPRLVVRPIAGDAFVRPIALVKMRGRTLPPVTERFVSALRRKLNDQAPSI
ncbi:LysR family transcriptional regulator [Mycetohabitans endofungorum]|uniref:LysR family transcriptional regulator n=1 Tax=Mycetohabitans endofungorum TaxID=417203 RepID=UPI002B05BFF2|nr:LysR family transcriptional regulator [Mycetohabitans endofungorum]